MFVYIAVLKEVQLPVHWRRSWSKRRPMSRSHLQLRQTPRRRKATSATLQRFPCLLHLQTLTFPTQYPWKAMERISLKICPLMTSRSFKRTETPHICICSTSSTCSLTVTDNCRTQRTSLHLQMEWGLRTQAHLRQQTTVSSFKHHSPSVDDISHYSVVL